jgi:nucleoside-diphosphate-sugar epimerase
MRVLVTGHEGYLGSVLTPLLGSHGHDVRGLDTGLYRECRTGPPATIPALRKDIRDVERQDFDNIDTVIHLAGFSNDPLGALDPDLTEKINHGAAVRVGECARAAGVSRLLFASSCSVFGAAGEDFLYEDSPFQPQTAYATSKMLAEQDLSQLATTDFAVTHLRLATIYGGSPCVRFDLVNGKRLSEKRRCGVAAGVPRA